MPVVIFVFTLLLAVVSNAAKPELADYSKLAFYPDRWKAAGVDFQMLAWEGKHVVFLTKQGEYDQKTMRAFVRVLDEAWQTHQELVGKSPQLLRQVSGKPTICALPKSNLSCGYGCGYLGSTGIEVSAFYDKDWPAFQKNPDAFAHYYFYEMGRNSFVFGDQHSLFTTGYAVFMRYVCMDRVGCADQEPDLRKTIEDCEQVYADSDIRFFDAFTNFSAGEKGNRLRDASGRVISPSDQPVMYATAMLKLRRDHGGDTWVKRFMHSLTECQAYKATDEPSAQGQCLNWLVCASKAAREDLSPVFTERWRMPLSYQQRQIMKRTNWRNARLSVRGKVNELLSASADSWPG